MIRLPNSLSFSQTLDKCYQVFFIVKGRANKSPLRTQLFWFYTMWTSYWYESFTTREYFLQTSWKFSFEKERAKENAVKSECWREILSKLTSLRPWKRNLREFFLKKQKFHWYDNFVFESCFSFLHPNFLNSYSKPEPEVVTGQLKNPPRFTVWYCSRLQENLSWTEFEIVSLFQNAH